MLAMWPSGWPAGAACRNPARPAAVAERERAGEGGGGSRVRFGGLVWAETRPAMAVGVHAGCLRRRPPVGSDAARPGHKCELAALERLP
jgi:hypothetical protein